MNEVNPNRIKFYEFLNGDIDKEQFENWIYETNELEIEIPKDHYIDLISVAFRTGDLRTYISKLVDLFFDWQEYEKWRTIKLLKEIYHDKIEIVLSTRKLRQLYCEQEERIKRPLITIKLGIGFDSVLDNCPIESEYHHWNDKDLKKHLEPVGRYREEIRQTAFSELAELLNKELKSIDMGQIDSTT